MENTAAISTDSTTSALVTQGLPIFTQNQTLKSTDLNAIVANLRGQQLDRAQLIGVGILEGLAVSSQYVIQPPPLTGSALPPIASVSVSAGRFITGDGYYIAPSRPVALPFYQALEQEKSPFNKAVVELFDITSPSRSSLPQSSVRSQADFELELKDKLLILVVEPRVRSRRALLSYDVIGEKQETTLRFFLVPKSYTSEPFFLKSLNSNTAEDSLNIDGFAVLKQQQARQQFLSSTVAKPKLRRIGYTETPEASISFSQLNSYAALKENYHAICTAAIASLTPALQEAKDLSVTFPKLADLINQLNPALNLNELFNQSSDRLTQTLDTLSNASTASATQPLMLQYFYDYLATIIAAYDELISAITAQSDFLLSAVGQQFLLLGPVAADDRSASSEELAASRSQFLSVLPSRSKQQQLQNIGVLYLRLLALLAEDSFTTEPLNSIKTILLTPGKNRTHTLSQQPIPTYLNYATIHSYWNQIVAQESSINTYRIDRAEALLHWPMPDNFYRVEGHLGKSAQSVLQAVLAVRDRQNLAFEILLLKLPANTEQSAQLEAEEQEKERLLHNFAQRYSAVDTLNGVPANGTLILVYTETSIGEGVTPEDTVVADFALPYQVRPESLNLQPPSSFTLSLQDAGTEFRSDDSQRYEILLQPSGGIVTGKGVVKDADKLYFQPSALLDELQNSGAAQLTTALTGRWGNYTKVLSVSLLRRPSAQFRLGNLTSGLDLEGLQISRDRFPLGIVATTQGGSFEISDNNGQSRNDLLKGTPPQLLTLPSGETLTELKLVHTISSAVWGPQSSQLTVSLESLPTPDQPLAKFRLGTFDSDLDVSTVELKRDRFPLALVPDTIGGTFEILDSEDQLQEGWLQGTPPRLLAPPEDSSLTTITVRHTISGNDNPDIVDSMTIGIEPRPAEPPAPVQPTLSISGDRTQFYKDDKARYLITFEPAGGKVEGRGVVEEIDNDDNRQYFFEPSQLGNDINEQINVLIIGLGESGLKTLSVTVYSQPLARFWLGDRVSSLSIPAEEASIRIAPGSTPILLTRKIQPGSFKAFRRNDLATSLNGFIRDDELAPLFIPPTQAEAEPIIVQYTLQDDSLWPRDQLTTFISVVIQKDEPDIVVTDSANSNNETKETENEGSEDTDSEEDNSGTNGTEEDNSQKDSSTVGSSRTIDIEAVSSSNVQSTTNDLADETIDVENLNSAIAQLSQESSGQESAGSVAFVLPDPSPVEPELTQLPTRTPLEILPFSSTLLPARKQDTIVTLNRSLEKPSPAEVKVKPVAPIEQKTTEQKTTPTTTAEVPSTDEFADVPKPGILRRIVHILTKPIG